MHKKDAGAPVGGHPADLKKNLFTLGEIKN